MSSTERLSTEIEAPSVELAQQRAAPFTGPARITLTPAGIARMQRTAGNAAVVRMLDAKRQIARFTEDQVRARAYERWQRQGSRDTSQAEMDANYLEARRQIEIEERAYFLSQQSGDDPVTNYYAAEQAIAAGRAGGAPPPPGVAPLAPGVAGPPPPPGVAPLAPGVAGPPPPPGVAPVPPGAAGAPPPPGVAALVAGPPPPPGVAPLAPGAAALVPGVAPVPPGVVAVPGAAVGGGGPVMAPGALGQAMAGNQQLVAWLATELQNHFGGLVAALFANLPAAAGPLVAAGGGGAAAAGAGGGAAGAGAGGGPPAAAPAAAAGMPPPVPGPWIGPVGAAMNAAGAAAAAGVGVPPLPQFLPGTQQHAQNTLVAAANPAARTGAILGELPGLPPAPAGPLPPVLGAAGVAVASGLIAAVGIPAAAAATLAQRLEDRLGEMSQMMAAIAALRLNPPQGTIGRDINIVRATIAIPPGAGVPAGAVMPPVMEATSGVQPRGLTGLPAVTRFNAEAVNPQPRPNDSERKIFETLAYRLDPNGLVTAAAPSPAAGSVTMFTERPMCPSCQNVMAAFRAMFPGINVDVIGG